MNCELISVGTEILLGDILNTNVQYLSKALAALGIGVTHHSTVGDNKQRLLDTLSTAFTRCDAVILTGGLGPTPDDLTKETCAEYFGKELYQIKSGKRFNALKYVNLFYRSRNLMRGDENGKFLGL